MRRVASTDLQGRTHALKGTAAGKKKQVKGGLLKTYCEVVNYLLKTYATNENISCAVRDIATYKKPDKMTPTEYGNALWMRTFVCGTVYDEDRVKGLFLEGLSECVKPAIDTFWGTHPTLDLHQLAAFATSSAAL